jgi:hypothetical protein
VLHAKNELLNLLQPWFNNIKISVVVYSLIVNLRVQAGKHIFNNELLHVNRNCSDYGPYMILIPRLTNSAVKGDH